MNFGRTFLSLILISIIASCAHVVNPDGGAKDSKAPILLKANPENASVNIQPKEIRLQFDEFVQLLNTDAIIVSPPLGNSPSIKAKNKSIRIQLKDSLLANTTYSINFGDGITDITERNPVKNFSYVFSTGPFLDTAFIAGTLKDARTLKPLKDFLVMLYQNGVDSTPVKKMPYYFTKTDAEGRWRIDHIKEATYRLFALRDENSNFLYDQSNELLAFEDTCVSVTGKGSVHTLYAFQNESAKANFLMQKTLSPGVQQIVWSKSLSQTTPTFKAFRNKYPVRIHFNQANDTAYIFTNPLERDSILAVFSYNDRSDTIAWEIKADEDANQWSNKFKALANINAQASARMSKNTSACFLPNQMICVRFNRPVDADLINKAGIIAKKDSVFNKRINVDSTMLSEDGLCLNLSNSLFEGLTDFTLLLPACKQYDSLKFQLHRASEEERASLQLHLSASTPNGLVLLLLNDQVQYVFPSTQQDISIKHLWPGNYKVMILEDKNQNGRWDTGNYFQHRQAEKVFLLPNSIMVKANWEVVQDIKMPY
jgi:methionine-rich copper-binding protein CopC